MLCKHMSPDIVGLKTRSGECPEAHSIPNDISSRRIVSILLKLKASRRRPGE